MLAKFGLLLAILSYSCKPHQTESQEEAVVVARNIDNQPQNALFFFEKPNLVIRFCSDNNIKQCVDKNFLWKGEVKEIALEGAETYLANEYRPLNEYYIANRTKFERILGENVEQLLFLNSKKNPLEKVIYKFMNVGSKLESIEQDVVSALFNITLKKGDYCYEGRCI